MGTLLTRVEHISGKGLIGFTKINEEIPLSAPTLKLWWNNYATCNIKNIDRFKEEIIELIDVAGEEVYFQLDELKSMNNYSVIAQAYNEFTKRE